MPTITVKNIPVEVYEKLKRVAEVSHRSINSEIIACIERAVCSQEVNPDLLLANARKLRAKTASHPIKEREFAQAKTTGRV
ncbi:MAG: Arc family DNA-binding protein [Phycisphaerae bacterium]|nr:Arc family DNA-binding protein [Phycisphaerae bacterium]